MATSVVPAAFISASSVCSCRAPGVVSGAGTALPA